MNKIVIAYKNCFPLKFYAKIKALVSTNALFLFV